MYIVVHAVKEGDIAHAPDPNRPAIFIYLGLGRRDVDLVIEGVVVDVDLVGANAHNRAYLHMSRGEL